MEHNLFSSKSVFSKEVLQMETELESVKNIDYGRPARMYHAYQCYTTAFNILVLKKMLTTSPYYDKDKVIELLVKYYDLQIELFSYSTNK